MEKNTAMIAQKRGEIKSFFLIGFGVHWIEESDVQRKEGYR